VYTAEDIGSYKPSLRNFHFMIERLETDLGIMPGQVLHTAQSLFHDHVPAKQVGIARAWIDRQGLAHGGSWGATARVKEEPEVDFIFPSLAAMASSVGVGGG
jgi:FMN phosphatase YigB (HAD superfamily)